MLVSGFVNKMFHSYASFQFLSKICIRDSRTREPIGLDWSIHIVVLGLQAKQAEVEALEIDLEKSRTRYAWTSAALNAKYIQLEG